MFEPLTTSCNCLASRIALAEAPVMRGHRANVLDLIETHLAAGTTPEEIAALIEVPAAVVKNYAAAAAALLDADAETTARYAAKQ